MTVVWLVEFCTSSEVPLIAAMEPEAPGNVRAPLPPVPLALPLVEGFAVVVVEADDELPQAAIVTAATPSAESASAFLTLADRMVRRRWPWPLSSPVVFAWWFIALPCVGVWVE